MQQTMDQKRKEGVNAINQKVNFIIADESIQASEKLARLQDSEQIRQFMVAYFDEVTVVGKETEVGEKSEE